MLVRSEGMDARAALAFLATRAQFTVVFLPMASGVRTRTMHACGALPRGAAFFAEPKPCLGLAIPVRAMRLST